MRLGRFLPLVLTAFILLGRPVVVTAENALIDLEVGIYPDAPYDQIMSGDTYFFNVSLGNNGLEIERGGETGEPGMRYTGRLVVEGKWTWTGKGSYHFGPSGTWYSGVVNLWSEDLVVDPPPVGEACGVIFNHTFLMDPYEFGVMPYENLEVEFRATVYPEVYNESIGEAQNMKGEPIRDASHVYHLIDEDKIDYVGGKLMDLEDDVSGLGTLPQTWTNLNEGRYLEVLETTRDQFESGDYVSALKTYQDYDNKMRVQLITGLMREVNSSIGYRIADVEQERRISELESSLEMLEMAYGDIQDSYVDKVKELASAKERATTAVMGRGAAALVSFVLGKLSRRLSP